MAFKANEVKYVPKNNRGLIIGELKRHPDGLNARRIHMLIKKIRAISWECVQITLAALAREHIVKVCDKRQCSCCGVSRTIYKIRK